MRREQTEIEEIFVGAPLTTRELKRFFEEQESLDFILSKSSLDDSVEYSNLIRISFASGYYMRFCSSKEGKLAYRFTIKEGNNMGGRGGSSGKGSSGGGVAASVPEPTPTKITSRKEFEAARAAKLREEAAKQRAEKKQAEEKSRTETRAEQTQATKAPAKPKTIKPTSAKSAEKLTDSLWRGESGALVGDAGNKKILVEAYKVPTEYRKPDGGIKKGTRTVFEVTEFRKGSTSANTKIYRNEDDVVSAMVSSGASFKKRKNKLTSKQKDKLFD